jgi:hypothetical protein
MELLFLQEGQTMCTAPSAKLISTLPPASVLAKHAGHTTLKVFFSPFASPALGKKQSPCDLYDLRPDVGLAINFQLWTDESIQIS